MFEGFSPEDFDAYLPEKWGSNVYTLPRRKVRDKLSHLGQELAKGLANGGEALVMHLSDDHPSLWNKKKVDRQWLFFSRDDAAEKKLSEIIDKERTLAATLADPTPFFRHVFLGVAVDKDGVEIGVRLHHDAWVDRKNLLALLAEPPSRGAFAGMMNNLPARFELALIGEEPRATGSLREGDLEALGGRFERGGGWLFAGARFGRDEVVSAETRFAQEALDTFSRLVPLYRFVAWAPDNDAVSMERIVADRRREIEKSQAELERERLERDERRRVEELERAALRKEAEDRAREDQAWRERERAMKRAAAAARAAATIQETRPDQPAQAPAQASTPPPSETVDVTAKARTEIAPPEKARPVEAVAKKSERTKARAVPEASREDRRAEPKETSPSRISDERKSDIRIGDGVVVKRGFLSGRFGIVQSLDEKGDLKVVFGALTSRVMRSDVEGRGPAPDRADPARAKRK